MPIIPTLWCSTRAGWRCLDDVVAVEALQRLEEVEGAARAPGAAHVDVHHGEAHEAGDDGDPVRGAGGVRVAVPGVLDQRGRRPSGHVREIADRERAGDVLGRMDV